MIKRLNEYFKEMYPLIPRLLLGFMLFFEVYFLVILTNGKTNIHVGFREIIGSLTVFTFFLALRIADDFKDYETDLKLFPDRALPSGRVTKRDLGIFLGILSTIVVILNVVFMNNLIFFCVLVAYALLMSFWFFQKHRIQPNLPLALLTHNPVQIVLNIYIISFASFAYHIPLITLNNVVIALTLYLPGLVWELVRKIRAPQDETEYTTYSKLFGYKKMVKIALGLLFLDMFTTAFLVYQLFPWAVVTVVIIYAWFAKQCFAFIKEPTRFKLISKFEIYEYLAEGSVILFIAAYLFKIL